MSIRQRLWDAGYAMAEPFINMTPCDKETVAVAFAEIFYIRTAVWLGVDDRVILGTAIGSLLAVTLYHKTLHSSR